MAGFTISNLREKYQHGLASQINLEYNLIFRFDQMTGLILCVNRLMLQEEVFNQ